MYWDEKSRADIVEHARSKGVLLGMGDLLWINGTWTIDGMPWWEWLESMTQD